MCNAHTCHSTEIMGKSVRSFDGTEFVHICSIASSCLRMLSVFAEPHGNFRRDDVWGACICSCVQCCFLFGMLRNWKRVISFSKDLMRVSWMLLPLQSSSTVKELAIQIFHNDQRVLEAVMNLERRNFSKRDSWAGSCASECSQTLSRPFRNETLGAAEG